MVKKCSRYYFLSSRHLLELAVQQANKIQKKNQKRSIITGFSWPKEYDFSA